ncbi:helix-turn-helix protein [Anseongella ginsenosidimutans]|uniref:Helix-turn-helix protein n=2 Tax=Anseongella ginsenosidimutans TaxID=496056 RepID=A0A4R3KUV7_9SPHI|nr:helix-turn-helix transcriptional regulator [Anseongella ginsenosidimutans]TCS89229.1 helix-turn-helix protein [Anseongella ginsenosidimutans]
MKVSNLQPGNALAGYVQRILVIENYRVISPFILPLFANGAPTLLFLTAAGTLDNSPANHLTLFGQTVFPRTLTVKENFTLIAYFFKPHALHALFGVPAHELADYPVSLNLLEPGMTAELKDRLLNAGSTKIMLSLLDNYIFRLITRTRIAAEMVMHAANMVASCTSGESLAAVQKELYVTERTFQRLFKNAIGIAPNLFRRICQFNAGFQQLNSGRFSRLSDIAFAHGYADQSHYIRTFKEFTGTTPKDYLKWAGGA